MMRFKHPVLAELCDKYVSKREPVDRNSVVVYVKHELKNMCRKVLVNRGEEDQSDLMKVLRDLRLEAESRKIIDQEISQNHLLIIQSYSEFLDLCHRLLRDYWLPFKNPYDKNLTYLLHSRVQIENAQCVRKENEKSLLLCPDRQHVEQQKQIVDQLRCSIKDLEEKKQMLQDRKREIEKTVSVPLVRELIQVRKELMDKEWAASQLLMSHSVS